MLLALSVLTSIILLSIVIIPEVIKENKERAEGEYE